MHIRSPNPVKGPHFRLHSEPDGPFDAARSLREIVDASSINEWSQSYFANLRDELRELVVHDFPPEPSAPEGLTGPLAEIVTILDERVRAVLALFPA